MKSLYQRQFFLMAGMILISFFLLGVSFIVLSYQYTLQEKQGSMERNALNIADYTQWILLRGSNVDDPSYQAYVSSVAEIADALVIVCNSQGQVAYASDTSLLEEGEQLSVPRPVVTQISSRGEYSAVTNLGGLFTEQRYVSGVPVRLNVITASGIQEQLYGLVFVTVEANAITELWRAFADIFFFTAAVVLCIAFITTSVTSLRQTRPLKEMAEAVRKFGHGEFDTRVETYGRKDEVGELAEAFNAMADSLAQAEARRSEFVANISHELKTPMTTIAGFADGILDGTISPEREADALHTISSETRRLSRLVRRMLDVSRLQSGEGVVAQERFDISELMIRVLVSLETKVNDHHLDVDTHLPEEPVMVWGDPDGITQVCYNLLDNAIKFSADGQVITLAVTPKAGKAYVSVRNMGETVPPEELSLLFDRFHKSDKSRSVDREGVGLGLYIVKTILNNHKENITVTSQDGVTEFTFTLTLA